MLSRDQLALLPEQRAIAKYFDSRNDRILGHLLWAFLALAAGLTLAFAARAEPLRLALALFDLALVLAIIVARRTDLLADHFRDLVAGFLLLEFALLAFLIPEPGLLIALGGVVFPGLLLFFRLPLAYLALLVAAFAGTGVWGALRLAAADDAGRLGPVLGVLLPALTLVAAAATITRRDRLAFVRRWRHDSTRERERMRMRDELADARKIQLGMLPASAPEVDGLELASLSLPASEVGGDYFDYFPLPGSRLAVVIGDVAGHGMASGLMLSGVKSGLFLLREELGEPLGVVDKLDVMVREAVRWRMLVTLMVGVVDPAGGRITAVSAGHPPVLVHSAADGSVRELGSGAPPLGTRLKPRYREETGQLGRGDTVVFYTDGMLELRNAQGEPFGGDRLRRDLERAGGMPTANQVRDALLDGLSRHRGDALQDDDLTLVVVRVR